MPPEVSNLGQYGVLGVVISLLIWRAPDIVGRITDYLRSRHEARDKIDIRVLDKLHEDMGRVQGEVQKLQDEHTECRVENAYLKQENTALRQRVSALEARLDQLQQQLSAGKSHA